MCVLGVFTLSDVRHRTHTSFDDQFFWPPLARIWVRKNSGSVGCSTDKTEQGTSSLQDFEDFYAWRFLLTSAQWEQVLQCNAQTIKRFEDEQMEAAREAGRHSSDDSSDDDDNGLGALQNGVPRDLPSAGPSHVASVSSATGAPNPTVCAEDASAHFNLEEELARALAEDSDVDHPAAAHATPPASPRNTPGGSSSGDALPTPTALPAAVEPLSKSEASLKPAQVAWEDEPLTNLVVVPSQKTKKVPPAPTAAPKKPTVKQNPPKETPKKKAKKDGSEKKKAADTGGTDSATELGTIVNAAETASVPPLAVVVKGLSAQGKQSKEALLKAVGLDALTSAKGKGGDKKPRKGRGAATCK